MTRKIISMALIIAGVFILSSCSPAKEPEMTSTETVETPAALELSVEELAQYNGKEGQPAYVAVDGIIYDVSSIPEWQDGIHQGKYEAGKDLSAEILKSPHGNSFLKKAVEVGKLK